MTDRRKPLGKWRNKQAGGGQSMVRIAPVDALVTRLAYLASAGPRGLRSEIGRAHV